MYVYSTEGVTRSDGREEANGDGNRVRVENWEKNGSGSGMRTGMVMGTGTERARERGWRREDNC